MELKKDTKRSLKKKNENISIDLEESEPTKVNIF